jgi:Flp pilus assembly protein TadB
VRSVPPTPKNDIPPLWTACTLVALCALIVAIAMQAPERVVIALVVLVVGLAAWLWWSTRSGGN